ncbi:MAG TPA: ribonuclease P protein component [Rubrobacteraceae bacterium]|nr:ribonuclease P protein component [Rubrobacteraceae bacterium]
MIRHRSTSLTTSPEFERVYRKGSVSRGRLLSVHVLPNPSGSIPRLGLSVSKKVGSAVKRNTVRRRLKEIFRSSLNRLPGNLDFVISARPASAEATFEELSEEFQRLLAKLTKDVVTREPDGS